MAWQVTVFRPENQLLEKVNLKHRVQTLSITEVKYIANTDFWFRWSKALSKNTDIHDWIKEAQYFVKDYALPFERINPIQIDAYTAFGKGINRGVGRQILPDTGRDGIAHLNEIRKKNQGHKGERDEIKGKY